ncbi:MAG: hypothetical protein B7Z73_01920 [Planctomycetia bacterium 21-64-5]|nr:MAG: hypothetical protein B7Z73_01920 [Planctomycetia bacterium 21-64-5]HQU41210.1 hypothetical protein [Pirellulales bacterium]
MSAVSDFRGKVEKVFERTPRGLLGLVDDLLRLGGQDGLSLTWHDGRCCVRTLSGGPQEATEIRVPKSVFRAILARVAVLCNERSRDSVWPYGGEGELAMSHGSASLLRIEFVNRPGEQRLVIDQVSGKT